MTSLKKLSGHNKYNKIGYLFIMPGMIFVLIMLVYPAIYSLIYSFAEWDGLTKPEFIGFENYKEIIKDEIFWISLRNSLTYSVLFVIFVAILGFFLAFVIERRIKGWSFFKVSWFIPVMLSQTVVSTLWGRILDPTSGLLNKALEFIGLENLQRVWLSDPKINLYVVIAVTVWQFTGITMLLLLTAMEGIPLEIHDAATIDGVNVFQRIKSIILPLIKKTLLVVTLLNIIWSLNIFDSIYILTRGGPGYSSSVLTFYLYKLGFQQHRFGYASTLAVLMFIIIFGISIIYLRYFRVDELKAD